MSASIKLYALQASLLLSLQEATARSELERHRSHQDGCSGGYELRVHLIHAQVVGSL